MPSVVSRSDQLSVVNNASWSPLYDLRTTSRKGRPSQNVHLHYRVNLSQSTGEDWNDAQLTLSTRAPEDLDDGIPKASTIQIQGVGPERYVSPFFPFGCVTPIPYHTSRPRSTSPGRRCRPRNTYRSLSPPYRPRPGPRSSMSRSRSRSRDRSTARYHSPSSSPTRRHSPVREGFANRILRSRSPIRRGRRSTTTPSEPPQYPYHPNETVAIMNDVTSVSFIMDGRCSIPGDGKLHKVTIAILPFTATIHHVITPRVSFDAYLQVCSLNSYFVFSR